MRRCCVNEKLQIPAAICGARRFQFQFPQNGILVTSLDYQAIISAVCGLGYVSYEGYEKIEKQI
jgi:hypothetical protein